MVVPQHPAESFAATHLPAPLPGFGLRIDEPVAGTSVAPLSMRVLHERANGSTQCPLREDDHPVKALALDRENESPGVGVEIRRPHRQAYCIRSGLDQQPSELLAVLRIPVEDEVPLPEEKAVEGNGSDPGPPGS